MNLLDQALHSLSIGNVNNSGQHIRAEALYYLLGFGRNPYINQDYCSTLLCKADCNLSSYTAGCTGDDGKFSIQFHSRLSL